ncbi:hypothetical protein Q4488_16670 [Amphritea sp. 1_MG-2023]|uniref:hypothetical protein n=1 Tax=Amphritea sp. 1_MG-2023 TaxID=3062670 RepID=UPI0026E3D173|nr:hypothetical protein [Amphritea sp. 1_MG-2023]MDO6565016.1 hypothetical protein [Amphritea sp. 1_MG-2023]
MKHVFKLAPLAVAVAAFSFTGIASAVDNGDGPRHHMKEGAKLSKMVSVQKHVKYAGEVAIDGNITVDSLGMAVIDQKQSSDDNTTGNDRVDNNATVDGNALNGSSGNIGVNVSAGDNNVQSNATALAAADESFVFGSADAEIFVDQQASNNTATNVGTINNATFASNALQDARGNIGVNIAAGSSNVQANSFAASVASGSMGEATVAVDQHTQGNNTANMPEETFEVATTRFSVGGRLSGSYNGRSTSGSYNGTNFGAGYAGTSTQSNDVYPEVWDGSPHGQGGTLVGHIDYDNQGADPGKFEFDESGRIGRSSESGALRFTEAGNQALAGTLTGSAQYIISRYVRHENNASLGDNVLRGGKGNIGVNITAGTSNLQNNSLAMTKVNALAVSDTPETPTTPE